MPESVVAFLDFQNVHLTGHGLFAAGDEPYRCVPDPSRVANLIASKRSRPSEATAIRVYRGRPDPNFQALPTRCHARDGSREEVTGRCPGVASASGRPGRQLPCVTL